MNSLETMPDIRGRILTHEELSQFEPSGDSERENGPRFRQNYLEGKLSEHMGTAVLYWKGILCGQGNNSNELLRQGRAYYGHTNLTSFYVPFCESVLDKAIKKGYECAGQDI